MRKKKYLYLLLLLILPIIFFGVAKISLNGDSIESLTSKEYLAATCYSYKINTTGEYEETLDSVGNYIQCGQNSKKQESYCWNYSGFQIYLYKATSECISKCQGGETINFTVKVGEQVELRKAIINKCGFSTDPAATAGSYKILSGSENITITNNSATSGATTYAKGVKAGNAKVELHYPLVGIGTKTIYANITVTGNSSNNGYTVNKTAWITQDTTVKNSSGSNETIKKCSQIYVTTCNGNSQGAICSFTYNGKNYSGLNSKYYNPTKPSACNSGGGSGNTPAPITPVQTPSITTEPINDVRYAKANASAGGYKVSCGDEVYVTTCETSGANPTCIVTKVNGVAVNTTTKVYHNLLVTSYDALPESCKSQTRYTLRTTEFYSSESEINKKTSDKISCAEKVTINGNVTSACSYSNNQYCKVTYNGKEGFVYRNNLTSRVLDKSSCEDEKQVEARCYHNETEDKYIWSEEDLSNKYAIEASVQTEDECNALNGDGEKNCKTSDKKTDVTDTSKKIKICYEKKNNKITDATDVMDMFTCAKDYTQNPVELTENTCDKVKNGTCHKTYLVSCSNGTRPAIEITASLLNQGLGTITIKGRKITNDVKSYYLDNSENPTVDSIWKDFADSNAVAYEQKEAGLYYAWVKDDKGILSRPMFAIVHDADITNTLQTLSVKDANDVAVTLNSIEGENAYLDVMPSEYSLLSNRLKNDKTLAGFDSLSMGYKIEVNSDKISVFATLTSSDASYVEGYEPRTVDLDYGENKILIKIKNKEGKVRTYTIIAIRTDDRVSNNLLTDLTVSKGKIEFDPYVTDYNIEVPKNTKKVSINGTLASDTSSFVEGNEPREIELTEDITTSVLEVISESGITRSYVLTFIKKGAEEETSTSAYLDTLTIEGTALDFNKEIYEYSVTVPYEYSSVNVYAFPESDNAFATVEGDRGLKIGANNLKITVKNGKHIKTYTVTVIRKEAGLEISNDVTLSSLTIKDYGIDFSPEKLDYTVKIKREKSLIITATPTSSRSEVYMYGNNSLTGFSTVRIKVVAENGATNIYSIDIQKDSYNKALEMTAVIIGSVIILGTGIIIVVRKKNKKMKEYLGK